MLGSACRLKMHFYPRPPGGGRRLICTGTFPRTVISIHALRVEGDTQIATFHLDRLISIHALRVEGDHGA